MNVELGKAYIDPITGIRGIATSRTEYLTGSPRVVLEFRDEHGRIAQEAFDEERLEQ